MTTTTPADPMLDPSADRTQGSRSSEMFARLIRSYLLWAGVIALAVALGSMLSKTTPSYDPWAWLVWGRQILHGQLQTPGGPTWKPLPVLFTTVFALFGDAQPDLWLLVARWGAVLSILMILRLTFRLVACMIDSTGPTRGAADAQPIAARAVALLPAALAAVVAATAMALSGEYITDSALGYSEALTIALGLIALDRALDGHPLQAFLIGMAVAWDRPESWVLWGPYGVWLMWRGRETRIWIWVVGAGLLTLVVWFIPQQMGGGSLVSGVVRAHDPRPNSAAYAKFPFWDELRYHAWESEFVTARLVAVLGGALAFVVVALHLRDLRGWLRHARHRAVATLLILDAVGIGWWVLISLETQAGFSGNDRYLQLGTALVCICTGLSVGWGAVELLRFGALLRARLRSGSARARRPPTAAVLAATTLLALLYGFVPYGWVGSQTVSLSSVLRGLRYQAGLRTAMATLIKRGGGYRAITACGPVEVETFQEPMAAWYLRIDMDDVRTPPTVSARGVDPVAPGTWPRTVLQDRAGPGGQLLPTAATIRGWEQQGARYTVTRTPEMTMYQDCSTAS